MFLSYTEGLASKAEGADIILCALSCPWRKVRIVSCRHAGKNDEPNTVQVSLDYCFYLWCIDSKKLRRILKHMGSHFFLAIFGQK